MIFISEKLWKKLHKIYGGGPTIKWKIEQNIVKMTKKWKPLQLKLLSAIKEEEIIIENASSESSHFEVEEEDKNEEDKMIEES